MQRFRPLLLLMSVIILSAFALIPHFSVQAATFDLTTCDPSATVNGAALAAAVTTANGNAQPDTINLAPGCVYTPSNRIWINADGGNAVTINGNNAILAAASGRALLGLDSGGTATLNNLTFRDGDAGFDTDNGGAILNRGAMTVNGSYFFNNVAEINGGAIFQQGDAITISGSTFQNNRGLYGGAIGGQGGPITVINSTFTGNSTPSGGSGGAIDNIGDILTIHSSTFSGNSSPVGADILFNGLGGSITNSIVASSNGCRTATGLSILARNNYLLGSCSLAGGSTANLNSGALNLGSLVGFPAYFIPGTGSVAINAGNSTLLPSGVTTDQRGVNRTSGTNTDLGAIETDGGMSLPTVSLTGTASINEGSSTSFTLSRTGATTNPLLVTLTLSLTGLTSPTDYTLSGGSISGQTGSVTALIPVGVSSVTITFNALNDGSSAEPDEALGVVIAANAAVYNINAGANNAGATINANGLTVTNTSDSGEGSLRQAITNANAFASGDTITFEASANGTITLATALPDLANNGTLTITGNGAANTVISGNNAVRVFNVASGANVTIQDVTVTNGETSGNGGGILNNGTLTLTNSTISGNTATSNGGGIASADNSTLTVTNSTISGNTATLNGGGIASSLNTTLTVTNSTISGNTATSAGGISNNGMVVTITNSTISGNTAIGNSGGIRNLSGTMTLNNSTISGNSAVLGGGVLNNATLTLNNSILANSASGGDCLSGSGDTVNASHSLIEDGLTCVNGTNTNNLTGDPALNGDLTLSATSIAINGGDNSLIPVGVTTDLAGNPRIQNTIVDMGAFESAFLPPTIVTITGPGTVAEGTSGDFTLTRTGDTTADLTVTVNITLGTDMVDADYDLTGGAISGQSGNGVTVTIPGGSASVNVSFAALAETPNAAEADNTLTITLVDDTTYDLGAAGTETATATIPANGLVVTTTANSGEGSLRQAITNANADGVNSTITFAASANGTITLATALPGLANNGTLTITGNGAASTIISGNNAVRVFNVVSGANVTIQDVTVTNGLIAGNGGGINNQGTLTLNNSTISGNLAVFGGGIFNNNGTLTVTDTTISGNTAITNGGGIQNNLGTLTVTNSIFSGNTANANSGGGMHVDSGTVTVTSSRFSGNSAFSGGGIFNGGTLTVNNSAVRGNSAFGGGGIYAAFGTLTANNSTFSGNGATSSGGNILSDSTVTLNNSIVANSTQSVDCVRNVGTINASHSLIRDGLTCVNGTNTNNLTGNPLLDANLVPQAGSPAINSGDNALIPVGITTDLAGNARIQGGTVDRGAFESAFQPPPTVTITGPGTVAEGASGDFTIARTGDTTGDLTVTVNITLGTGMVDADYDLSGGAISGQSGNGVTVTIPGGSASVNVTFSALAETPNAAEADNTLTITLVDDTTYDLGAAGTETATATIPANGLVVTTTADSGEGSLRQAITNANADGVDSTITFAASANGTITLASALPDLANNGTLTITGNGAANTVISGNNAVRVLNLATGANVTIQDVTVTNGATSGNGGGIANNGRLTLTNSTISGNSASIGGGIFSSGVSLSVINSTISGNSASVGGGIYNNAGALTVTNSIISGNSVNTAGGGIYNIATVTVNNSAISGNTSSGSAGGGIYNSNALTLNNSTVSGNSAGSAGGGIYSFLTLTLNNSIVANSTNGGDCFRDSGTVNASHSLIEDGLGCVNGTNTNNLTGDPALNGDLTLSDTSIAINAGDNALIPGGITTDLAGNPRIQNTTVDMGAFESAFTLIPTVSISATDNSGAEEGGDPVTFTVTRSGASNLSALTVSYTVGGSADNGTDYTPTLTGSVDIPATQDSVTITLTPVDDLLAEGSETVTLTIDASAAYTLGVPSSDSATIADNDSAGVTVTESDGSTDVTEGGAPDTFTVRLNTAPVSPVTITLTPDAGLSLSTTTLNFDDANWMTEQIVEVTADDDAIAQGPRTASIALAVTSAGADYTGLVIAPVNVNISDNDSAGIVISPNSFSVTEGLTRSYQIRLETAPTVAPVTIWVAFDTAQLTVNGNSAPFGLLFSDATPQTISFSVNGNDEINTIRDLVITHTVTNSASPEYPVGTQADVTLQIVDYPPPPPTPLCEAHNFDEGGVVRSSITDALGYAINCRILFQNGASTSWLGTALYSEANLGVPGLLELGVQQAIDIFSPPGMTYFEGGAVFCLRGQGTLIWLAASGMPRHPEIIGSYTVPDFPGFTCATLFEPGTLILVSRNPVE